MNFSFLYYDKLIAAIKMSDLIKGKFFMTELLIMLCILIHVYTVLFAIGNVSWGWIPPQYFS